MRRIKPLFAASFGNATLFSFLLVTTKPSAGYPEHPQLIDVLQIVHV
jgi:hypothetical protein